MSDETTQVTVTDAAPPATETPAPAVVPAASGDALDAAPAVSVDSGLIHTEEDLRERPKTTAAAVAKGSVLVTPEPEDDAKRHLVEVTRGSVRLAEGEHDFVSGPPMFGGAYHVGAVLDVTAAQAKAFYAQGVAKRVG